VTGARRERDADASGQASRDLVRIRAAVVLGALAVAVGIALAGSVDKRQGGALVVGAWLLLGWAIHRYGRLSEASGR
jgi:hypothetical protein